MSHFIKVKKNKPKNRVLALFLLLGVVCSHTIPIFASNGGTAFNFTAVYYYTGQNQYNVYTNNDTNTIKVPLYLMYFSPDAPDQGYISGYIRTSLPNFTFSFNGTTVAPTYFEVSNESNIIASSMTNNLGSVTVNFDNHMKQNNNYYLIGYYVFEYTNTSNLTITISPSNGLVDRTPATSNQHMYYSTYELGFVDAMVQAINEAYNAENVFDILDNIGTNSGYLPEIFTNLQRNHNALYQLIENLWHTDQAILSVNQDTYRTVLSILAILQSEYGVNESEAESQVEAIDDELGQLELDMNVAKPSAVANIADEYVNQIDTTYNSNVFGFLNFPTIILLMCIVMAFAIISYMLYGGQ